jgi:protein TonB
LPPPRKTPEPKAAPKPKPEPKLEPKPGPPPTPAPPPKAEVPPVSRPEQVKKPDKPPAPPQRRRRETVVAPETPPPAPKPEPKARPKKGADAETVASADSTPAKKSRKSAEPKPARSEPAEKGKSGGKPAKAAREIKPAFSAGLLSQQIAEVGADMTRQRTAEWEDKKIIHTTAVKSNRLVVAAYEQAWQEKVERIGNLNYPDEARRDKLAGSLVLAVGIKQDGSVYSVQLQQSSGHAALDQSARDIIKLAAPFAPLPQEIRDEVEVLVITRTWRYDSNYQLTTSNSAGRAR